MTSKVILSRLAPVVDRPCPRAMACSRVFFGTPAFFAAAIVVANAGLLSGFAPYTVASSQHKERAAHTRLH